MPVAEGGVLDRRTLNRTLLARQHLLERATSTVADMVEHLVGMQAQVPRDPYISLWSRLDAFAPADLERLLLERRAVRMTLLRTTLHLVTARDARTLRAATQAICERAFASSPFRAGVDGVDLDVLCVAGSVIVEERPRTIAELGAELAQRWPDRDPTALAYAVRYLVPLVQVTPRGLWRRPAAPRVTTLAAWLDGASPTGAREEKDSDGAIDHAIDSAVLRYLRAFGPATAADIRTWSWLTDVRRVIGRLRPRLRTYRDESGRELFDVDDGMLAAPDATAPARFLGEYDNVFLSHADRSRITGDGAWGEAFVRRGSCFVDGFLAGAWRTNTSGPRTVLSIEPRTALTQGQRDEVAAEGEALLRFLDPETPSPTVEFEAA